MTELLNPLQTLAKAAFPPKKPRGRPPGAKNRPLEDRIKRLTNKLPPEATKPETIIMHKTAIIQLLETKQAENLSDAAEILGIPKLTVYKWRRTDLEWAALIKEAGEIVADRLENELLASEVNGKPISMPYVLARMFRLKAIRPQLYKEKYPINVEDSKMVDLLTEIKKMGQNPSSEKKKSPEEQKRGPYIAIPILDI